MEQETPNRNLTLKHLASGRHGIFDGEGDQIGLIDHKHLVEHMAHYQKSLSRLSSPVIPSSSFGVDREVARRIRELMAETGLDAAGAMKEVLGLDRGLAERYRAAHTKIGG